MAQSNPSSLTFLLADADDGRSDDYHDGLFVGDDGDELLDQVNVLRAVANHQGVV